MSLTINIVQPQYGTITITPDKTSYESGEVVTVETVADPGYAFDHWTRALSGSTQNPKTFTITEDMEISSHIKELFEIKVIETDRGDIEFSPPSEDNLYKANQEVELKAVPSSDFYTFENWIVNGQNYGNANPLELLMTKDYEVETNFSAGYTLDVKVEGAGTVIIDPDQDTYDPEDGIVVLYAEAEEGSTFIEWIEDGVSISSDDMLEITPDGNRKITAVFETFYNVKVEYDTSLGSIEIDGEKISEKTVAKGTKITLEAIPELDVRFDRWGIDENLITTGTKESESITVTVDSNLEIDCFFIKQFKINFGTVGDGEIIYENNVMTGEHLFDKGTVLNIFAQSGGDSDFDKWIINGIEYEHQDIQIIAEENTTVEAYYINYYRVVTELTHNNDIGGKIEISPDGEGRYYEGTEVTAEYIRFAGYHIPDRTFPTGATQTGDTYTITVNGDAAVDGEIKFSGTTERKLGIHVMTIAANTKFIKSVSPSGAFSDYVFEFDDGELVTIELDPLKVSAGYEFVDWQRRNATGDWEQFGVDETLEFVIDSDIILRPNIVNISIRPYLNTEINDVEEHFNPDIALIELTERLVGSNINRPLKNILKNQLHIKQLFSTWLNDPFFDKLIKLQKGGWLEETGDGLVINTSKINLVVSDNDGLEVNGNKVWNKGNSLKIPQGAPDAPEVGEVWIE